MPSYFDGSIRASIRNTSFSTLTSTLCLLTPGKSIITDPVPQLVKVGREITPRDLDFVFKLLGEWSHRRPYFVV